MNHLQFPSQSKLTVEQQLILNEKSPVSIFGSAGTGKTIVSIYRHIENWEKRDVKSFLITFTHTFSDTKFLAHFLKIKTLLILHLIQKIQHILTKK
jgi:hypothetical protein